MQKTYYNRKVKAEITLFLEENDIPPLNREGSFLKFVWNKGPEQVKVAVDGQIIVLTPDQVLCTTYLQKMELLELNEQLVVLFRQELLCRQV